MPKSRAQHSELPANAPEEGLIAPKFDKQSILGNAEIQARLSEHLINTGRATGEARAESGFGGKRTPAADTKRESYSRDVLGGMESATQKRQAARNLAKGENKPLAHAVSGHGPDSDQVPRLLSGRRNDEVMAEKAAGGLPATEVQLTGNANGLEDRAVPEWHTVGSDASSISGAFGSSTDMLMAVEDAYSQASTLEAWGRGRRAEGKPSTAANERFVRTVGGGGGPMGSSMSIDPTSGAPALGAEGASLSAATMQGRYERMKKTDGLQGARMVMDPAFVTDPKTGEQRRAGWDIQTAFPVSDKAEAPYSSPDAVDQELAPKEQVKDAQAKLDEAKGKNESAKGSLVSARSAITNGVKGLKAMIRPIIDGSKDRSEEAKGKRAALEQQIAAFAALEAAATKAASDHATAAEQLAALGEQRPVVPPAQARFELPALPEIPVFKPAAVADKPANDDDGAVADGGLWG